MSRNDKLFIYSLTVCAFVLAPSSASCGCVSDCRDEYESEVESCMRLHDDPDDSYMLTSCIESAKDEFDSCKDECES